MDASQVQLTTVYAPARPVSLRETLSPLFRGATDPTHRWAGSALWRTLNTSAGPATLHLVERGGEIHATAWGYADEDGASSEGPAASGSGALGSAASESSVSGSGALGSAASESSVSGSGALGSAASGSAAFSLAAEIAISGVPELCGEGDDWSGLDLGGHPILVETLRRSPGLRLCRTNAVFEALVAAILEQKVTNIEARRAWRYLLARYGSEPPGPAPQGMRVLPGAEVWRRIPSWEWHRAGVGSQQAETAVRAAEVATSAERTLVAASTADAPHPRGGTEVAAKLRSIRGIGVWTAAETLQRSHGDPDSPSVGDYHLPAVVGYVLREAAVDDDGMLELLEPFSGHRHRVVRLILAAVAMRLATGKPKLGPRMPVRNYRSF